MESNHVYIEDQRGLHKELDEILSLKYWVFDTETTGLDQHTDKVTLLQIGDKTKQFVINPIHVNIGELTPKLEDERFRKWGHNLLFDYKMMKRSFGITMEGLRDTMIAERLLTAGLNNYNYSLEKTCLKRLNIQIDKEMQTSFIGHRGVFSEKQIEYAALDCVYPDMLRTVFYEMLKKEKMLRTFDIECNSIQAFGDIEYCGMLLDKDLWEANLRQAVGLRDASKEILMQEVAQHVPVDLFGNPDFNPKSSKQVLELFSKLFPDEMVDMNKKASAKSEVLEALVAKHENNILPKVLLEYRKHEKNVTTYGYSYINAINPKTGRVHPRIDQLGTDTGRPTGRKPNMLNLPKDQKYRTPWIAGPGRKMITVDYGACELRILASHSGDPVMCKGFNAGVDYHNYTASEFMTDKSGNTIVYDKITKPMRTVAKIINFGITYGMGLTKFAYTVSLHIDKARVYFKAFKETFNVAMSYLDKIKASALKPRDGYLGYSTTFLGRRRYFRIPRTPGILYKNFAQVGSGEETLWTCKGETLKYNPKDPWDENLPEPLQRYYGTVAAIKRSGGNAVIQGGNADITKIAMHLVRRKIREYEKQYHGGKYVAHIALQVYDELVVDCPEDKVDYFLSIVREQMILAGEQVITKVPVEVDSAVSDHWVK